MWLRLVVFFSRMQDFVTGARREREADLEIEAHLDGLTANNIRRGMAPAEARRLARVRFGGVMQVKDLLREQGGFPRFEAIVQDMQYALRGLMRSRGFTTVATLTLALGIGATSAVFSVVTSVLLQPLPFERVDGLVKLVEHVPADESLTGTPRRVLGMDLYELTELRSRTQTLSHVAAHLRITRTFAGRDEAVRLVGAAVSPTTFPMLGASPQLGRVFAPAAERPGTDVVVVLSQAAWQRYFQGDPNIIGRIVTLDSEDYTVVGVMGTDFESPNAEAEFWIPFVLKAPPEGMRSRVDMTARLGDGVSLRAAETEVTTVLHQLRGPPVDTLANTSGPPRFESVQVRDAVAGPARPALLMFSLAVGFVLLISCANVANLLLVRSAARQRDISVRAALGAGRGRLITQSLMESVLLALAGGIAGLALAVGGVRLLHILGTGLSRVELGSRGACHGSTRLGSTPPCLPLPLGCRW